MARLDSYQDAIRQEILAFEKQLKEFRQNAATLEVNIGTQEELMDLKVNTREMEDFSKALDETLLSQTGDIRALQVWPLTQIFLGFLFVKKSLICLLGKSMAPRW